MIFRITNDCHASTIRSYHITFGHSFLAIVRALGVNVGSNLKQQLSDSWFCENCHQVDCLQRSDQFSFSVALYHALYGEFPFAGEGLQELLGSMETGAIGLERSVGQAARVRKALRRGLSVDPSQRFPSMGELLAALEPSLGRRGGWIAGAVLLFLAGLLVYFWPSSSGDPCSRAGDGMDQSWSPARQALVHTAFLRTELPYAEAAWRGTKQRLDGYAERWREQATVVCWATFIDRVQF